MTEFGVCGYDVHSSHQSMKSLWLSRSADVK